MLLPGPEAQQLAIYVGWLLHRTAGGLVAGTLFVLPGFVAILGLSILYALWRDAVVVEALFFGLKAAVLAVVIEAVLRIGRRALRSAALAGVAAAAFVAIFFFEVPFPLIVVGAAVLGLIGGELLPRGLDGETARRRPGGPPEPTVIDLMAAQGALAHARPNLARAGLTAAAGLVLWALPFAPVVWLLGSDSALLSEGLFFSKAAVVTFGGAYAVLAYVAQKAVETYGWLEPGEMLDGLGMAETTPGPLIMVVQFVGFLGAFRDPGPLPPLWAGVLGAAVTTWVTFVPCFIWIFLGAPYVEALRGSRRLNAALSSITAAVVGVILNLAVWFSLHVMFGEVRELHFGPLRLLVPSVATLDVPSLVLAGAALVAMLRFRVGMGKTLAASAALGLGWRLLG